MINDNKICTLFLTKEDLFPLQLLALLNQGMIALNLQRFLNAFKR
ncbi:hypothetical protein RintRC_0187 [Richelia intracellularis]|nr:hypothetical protein RintRC_0187 [Richelia intracellularis]